MTIGVKPKKTQTYIIALNRSIGRIFVLLIAALVAMRKRDF